MDFKLPELGEGVYEAELVAWLVQPGQTVKRGQALMEVLTDKATMEVPSPFAGTISEHQAEPGQRLKVGQVVLIYTSVGQAAPKPAEKAVSEAVSAAVGKPAAQAPRKNGNATPSARPGLAVRAAPSVRYLARKLGIDLQGVGGSGPQGRILVDDLAAIVPSARATAKRPADKVDYGTPGTSIKLQGLRRKIAERMAQAKQTIPHYSYVDECDVTDLVRLRDSLKQSFAQAGVKLTYLAFLVKAVAQALKDVPIVNASFDEKAGQIVLHDHYHIGVAVAAPAGLIVPVIHDADRKDLAQIARDLDRLSAEARAGKAKLEDLRGATFTITSIGNIGGLISTPIINPPEVGILGLGKIVKRPVYDPPGTIRPADLLYLSFSFDHRVVDGAVGAAFGNEVRKRLESPGALLLPESLRTT
jgi:pyruvate dehydrogenase E2 component (dihydrolipoamide acetyltransferase)/2-oxoisovalerate dehydrogenase E2 component (dihydrolipoyl transacylase)